MPENPYPPKGWHSRGYLPHLDSPERIQHVIFRTAGSLPKAVLEAGDIRARFDALLDRGDGPLADPAAARIVEEAVRHFDGERFRLFAWVVMPNHAHVVVEPVDGVSLGSVVRSWKAFSAAKINKAAAARGPFWARDYFDRYMRDEDDLARTIDYVERNPVAAGLAASPEDWPWSSARLRRAEERA
jgi:putative transposase